ncbi:MAG: 23S rRNA (adenine(2503)-C(2))-methyltransferase RlmN [Rhodobacteraceae bacterium]|nr:23S rRNA (adenine(2503)-C(2))-methyltransferase RlmN [Paracoccaceae bacterium]
MKLTSLTYSRKHNILGLGKHELLLLITDFETQPNRASMRVNQVWSWIYCHGKRSFDNMTNIDKNLREKLENVFKISRPNIEKKEVSNDGTIKYLFCLEDQSKIETVFIPEETRSTLCISSQVGCTLSCSFCHTGTQKLVRNLSSQEIIGQVIAVYDDLDLWKKIKTEGTQSSFLQVITNIVFMGMGEPLLNYEEVKKACNVLMDSKGLDFSRRRITLSTAGIVPKIKKAHDEIGCMIAVSLHATEDKTRDTLVPINKKWNLKQLISSLKDDVKLRNSERITFEYVMLDGVNDTNEDAHRLVRLLKGLPSKVNLIPFNSWTGSQYKRSSTDRIKAFRDIIIKSKLPSPIRKPRGEDIMAACGQLKSSSIKEKASI